LFFADVKPFFAGLSGLTGAPEAWRAKLAAWDGVTSKDSTEATVYLTWLQLFNEAFVRNGGISITKKLDGVLFRDALRNGHAFCQGSCTSLLSSVRNFSR
jgi:acyl-homoserine lactone acylase PvdQ